MPFYEYECASCKFYTEVLQKISDAPLRKCPSCGRSTLKKLVSAPVFRLKGAGWYETDFKSDKEGKRNLVAAEKDESVKTEATKTEDKPAGTKPAAAESKPAAESRPASRRKPSPVSRPRAKTRRKPGSARAAAAARRR